MKEGSLARLLRAVQRCFPRLVPRRRRRGVEGWGTCPPCARALASGSHTHPNLGHRARIGVGLPRGLWAFCAGKPLQCVAGKAETRGMETGGACFASPLQRPRVGARCLPPLLAAGRVGSAGSGSPLAGAQRVRACLGPSRPGRLCCGRDGREMLAGVLRRGQRRH